MTTGAVATPVLTSADAGTKSLGTLGGRMSMGLGLGLIIGNGISALQHFKDCEADCNRDNECCDDGSSGSTGGGAGSSSGGGS